MGERSESSVLRGLLSSLNLSDLLEYVLGMGATANCIYQMYRLCYKAIAVAPIVVFMPGLSETAVAGMNGPAPPNSLSGRPHFRLHISRGRAKTISKAVDHGQNDTFLLRPTN
jgi:hypothetical protein